MKKLLIMVSIGIVGATVFGVIRNGRSEDTVNYRLVAVEQGDLAAVVSATGTLDAVTTVQVGTQVSGIIDEVYADYNDTVKAGQVIARIDTTLLANAVAAADAQLARSHAELRQALREYERFDSLHTEHVVSDSEYSTIQYNLDVARASVQSADVDLTRARQTLKYATITSPIDGTVVSRSMEVGQTVQASFSAPELFLIAGDLTRMQILAAVDESDIGQIVEGQTARFTVQAYPDDVFEGTVRQVRLQSATEDNVVNYTAVVNVVNADGRLLPGMTATVDFIVDTAADALYVSNAALRYTPDTEAMTAAMERMRSQREARSDSTSSAPRPGAGPGAARGAGSRGMLWTADSGGQLVPIPVRTGISDGSNTVVLGRELEAGQLVIAGVSRSATTSSQSSPFQQQQQTGQRPPGPPAAGGF